MSGYPVQDYTYAGLMHAIHEIAEIVRRSVAGSGGIEARHLIAPRQVKGMLADSHQLDVGKPHVGDVIHQVIG